MTGERSVYFIQAGGKDGPIKIGSAGDPEGRRRTLQISHHQELRVLGTCGGGYDQENRLHRDLAQYRIRGEWYQADGEVLAALGRCQAEQEQARRAAGRIAGELSAWAEDCVAVTGVQFDRVSVADLMSHFDYWVMLNGAARWPGSKRALRDALDEQVRTRGGRWNATEHVYVGVRLH